MYGSISVNVTMREAKEGIKYAVACAEIINLAWRSIEASPESSTTTGVDVKR